MSDEILRGGHEREDGPATPGQIAKITGLASQLVDGAVALTNRTRLFSTDYFEGEFFHHWLARYIHGGGDIEALGDEEAKELLESSGQELPDRPGMRNNSIGFSLALGSSLRPDTEIGYDGGTLDLSIPIGGDALRYYAHRDSDFTEGLGSPIDSLNLPPRNATQSQAETALKLVRLTSLLEVIGRPHTFRPETALQVREDFDEFERGQLEEGPANPSTVAMLKAKLLSLLDQQDTSAAFIRRFLNGTVACSAGAHIRMDANRQLSRQFEAQVRIPSQGGEFDEFVTAVYWDDRGNELDHVEYTETDVWKTVEADPDMDISDVFTELLPESLRRVKAQKHRFRAEKRRGMHPFSRTQANWFTHILEDPGEVVLPRAE